MNKKLTRYLRPHRLRWRLTQEEVGALLGYADGSFVSRMETGSRAPSLADALALEVIFGVSLVDLFPEFFQETEDAVLRRAKELYEKLQSSTSKAALKKQELLKEIIARAISRLPSQQ